MCLETHAFDIDYLKANLVAFASDGASVMVGRKSGVATKLKDLFSHLITWDSLNHRLELAVCDAASETQGINHFRSFVDCLFALYSRSPLAQLPLAQTQLETEAAELEIQLKKIGHVLSTRWVSSSFRTVSAVWRDYSNKVTKGIDDETKSNYAAGLQKRLCSPEFVVDLGLMYDSLSELSVLSLALQNREMNLPHADRMIRRSIRRIKHLKEEPGPMMLETQTAVFALKFGSTRLTANKSMFLFIKISS